MKVNTDFSGLPVLYSQADDAGKGILQNQIESCIGNPEYRESILKEFSTTDISQDNYTNLLVLRYKHESNMLTQECVNSFISNIQEWAQLYADAFYYVIEAGLPINTVASIIDPSEVSSLLFNNKYFHHSDFSYLVLQRYENDALDAKTMFWLSVLYLNEMASANMRQDRVNDLFRAYAKSIYAYLSAVVKSSVLNEENAFLLPKQWRAGFYCSLAVAAYDKGQNSSYIMYLKAALQHCPELVNAIKILTAQFDEKVNKPAGVSAEFQEYAVKVKEAIRGFIKNTQFEEAEQILAAYEKLYSTDASIPELKQQILLSRQNTAL
jgi:hypothetical protein